MSARRSAPSIPKPGASVSELLATVQALKETVELLTRRSSGQRPIDRLDPATATTAQIAQKVNDMIDAQEV